MGPSELQAEASGAKNRAAMVAFAATIAFVVLLLVLHVVKSDCEPSWHFISEYEIGRHGWIMQAAFFALAAANLAALVAIRRWLTGIGGGIGALLFLIGTGGTILAGIFAPDPMNTAPDAVTTSGNLHNLGGALGLAGFIGTLIMSAKLLRSDEWRPARRVVVLATTILVAGFLIAFVSIATITARHDGVFGPDAPVGWPNRIGILSGCVWLAMISYRAARISPRTA